jgi:hypothetical protein
METVSIVEVARERRRTSLFDSNNLVLEKDIQADILRCERKKLIRQCKPISTLSSHPKESHYHISRKNNEIVVNVADTGIGIAPKDHAALSNSNSVIF